MQCVAHCCLGASAGRQHRAIEVLLRSINMKQALLPPNDLAIAGASLTRRLTSSAVRAVRDIPREAKNISAVLLGSLCAASCTMLGDLYQQA